MTRSARILAPGAFAVTLGVGLAVASTDLDTDPGASAALTEAAADNAAPERGLAPRIDGIRFQEREVARLRTEAVTAANRARDLSWELVRDGDEISDFLTAAQTLGASKADHSVMHPDGPLAAVRAAAMVRALRAEAESRADRLTARMAAIHAAERKRDELLERLAEGLERLDHDRRELAGEMRFVSGAAPAPDRVLSEALATAGTIDELISEIARRGNASWSETATNQNLIWPAPASVVQDFGTSVMGGAHRHGIELSAWPMSPVVSPAKGGVRYAGPFLDYGNIVIIEDDSGLMAVLAGLSRVTVENGTEIAQGDVIGILGGRSPEVQDYVRYRDQETVSGLRETLYMEIRHGQRPVDPVPLLSGENG
ncbi:murein hydrolase activator EnvC family protein [Amaricoccus tamworthensis]|uniref:murein hydrolase activator EnvC family protein n=1 Tax=Amaricoccus tamworthensis TaxID=57002 RepID=UPI003C7C512A